LALSDRSALAQIARAGRFGRAGGTPGVIIAERAGLGIASVAARRGKAEELRRALRDAHSVDLPGGLRVAEGPKATFLGTGPGRWLAMSRTLRNGDLAIDLAQKAAGLASISDQSGGRAVVRLSGPKAREILAKGLPIDLHPTVFGPGSVVTGVVNHIGAQLLQVDDAPTYDIVVFRSLGESFWRWLTDAAAEFGYLVEPARD
jgi:sarcosine oxidase subunit gamma